MNEPHRPISRFFGIRASPTPNRALKRRAVPGCPSRTGRACGIGNHRGVARGREPTEERGRRPAAGGHRRLARTGIAFGAVFSLVALAAPGSGEATRAENWPQFRGPHASGVAAEGNFPEHFGPDTNLVWRASVPSGHSSPCIWEDRIFLTGFDDGKLVVLALDRRDGRVLWRHDLPPGVLERGSGNSHPACSTPATDGERVFVYFGAFGLAAYELDGREAWRKPLPTPITQHGTGTSPVLAGDTLVLVRDQDAGSHALAVDKKTGDTLWKTERPEFRRGFSTPLPWPEDRPEEVIVAGTLRLAAYDLKDGTERWTVAGLANEMVTSPVAGGGLVFVAGWTPGAGASTMPSFDALLEQGDRNQDGKLTRDEAPPGPAKQHFLYIDANKDGLVTREEYAAIADIFRRSKNVLLAIRPGGRGDVTASHIAWSQARGLPYVPSPLYYEGRVYLVKNGGLASCFEAASGRVLYLEERLGAIGDYYASPVAAGGKICAASQPGTVVVYRAGDTLDVLARNPLGEEIMATPAIVGDRIYVRTARGLYAFGDSNPPSSKPTTGRE